MQWNILALLTLNLTISEINSQGTWYLPGPRGKSVIPYTGIFTDPQTGYAVKNPLRGDTANAVQKSVDAGATWTPLLSGPNIPLRSIHFPRHKLGFVMATNGTTILKTVDAGLNWERWEADQRLDNIKFKSENIGYAMPDRGGFLKSVDGGKTWHTVPLGGIQPSYFYFGTEQDGFIIPRNTGVASDSTLMKTNNGGAKWEWILGAPIIEEMAFVNPENGFATGSQFLVATTANQIPQIVKGVYKTTDGGQTWKVVLSNKIEETAPFWTYQSPNMLTPTLGYVIANRSSNSGPTLGSRIMKTVNGGETWTIDYETADMHLFILHFPDNNTGYAKGSVMLGNAEEDKAILIRYRYNPVSIAPIEKNRLPVLRMEKGVLLFGENAGSDALGRNLLRILFSGK